MNLLAQNLGTIKAPVDLPGTNAGQVIGNLIERIIQLLIVGASIYALINLVLAGYSFMSAGDDPKKIEGAWGKIWQSLLGLAVSAGAFVLASVIGNLIFGPGFNILSPTITPIQ